MHTLFADTIEAGAVAMVPQTGEVLAMYSSPSIDPNRFVGGVSASYYDSLRTDPRLPLYNKVLQATQPPGSTFKLATSVMALSDSLITFDTHMPQGCNGYYYFGNRTWHCWKKEGHGNVNLFGAIAQSCDVYFYQLGQKLTLSRIVAGGVALGFDKRSGIDLPEERRSDFPNALPEYFNKKYGPRNWTPGEKELNLAIGQGENAQTVLNMAKFYAALAGDGTEPIPMIKKGTPKAGMKLNLPADQLALLRKAMMGVLQAGGTAAASALKGIAVAGKTGTAETKRFDKAGHELYWAWFAGMAPAEAPKIVVVVMFPEVTFEGSGAARFATKIIERYLHTKVDENSIEIAR
jgi:penicillin-binding protein 2